MGVTTVFNSLILGGWVRNVLKNGDKNRGVEGWVTTVFRLFVRATVLDKKCHFPAYSYTRLFAYALTYRSCILGNFVYSYL